MRYNQFITFAGDWLEEDDPIIMVDHTGNEYKCHVAGVDENKFPLVWICGCTSWSVLDHPKKHFIPSGGWYGYRFFDDIDIKLNVL
jgi:hypothetical protein